ncbi:MAG TPA: polysaccharide biosynthesis tyrosine autokinase [Phototrophicaceae bacterium]|nr:polysaccharide biosynthesis tyrosine autokinase [Phototrophicaceae bacterium]
MKQLASPFTAIIKLLFKWWWLIAISVALGVGVGYFIRTKQPNVYVATTRLLFGQNFLISGATGTVQNVKEIQDLVTVYSGLVRLSTVLVPVIEDLELNIDMATLNGMMSVTEVENLPLLEISITDTRPDRAANIANRVAQELITQSPADQISQETAFRREQLASLQKQIEELQKEYDNKLAVGGTLTSAFEISQNLQERTAILTNLQELRKLYAEMSAGLGDQARLVSIFEAANPDTVPIVSNSMISVILAGAAGLILSILTIVLLGYFDDRLMWQEGQTSVLDVKALGPLGVVPKNKLPLYLITMPDAIESEVLRQLRAKIVLAAGGVPPRTLTVTSYDSGDGKTVTAANLALAFAQAGQQTLLVDGDIRKGNLHEIFRLPNIMGISDILAGRTDIPDLLSQALLDSGYDRLTILTSGRSSADAPALLSGQRFSQLFEILRTQFEVVVMDSVPTIGGPDSAFLAEVSDGVLIVVDGRRTTQKGLRRTLQTLQQARQVNVYGLVYNRTYLQATSTYNKPYYRRTIALSPERLEQEMKKATKNGRNLSRHIMVDQQGQQLYSLSATATQLGISEETVKNWIKVGYLKTVHQGRRQWIPQNELQNLLERLPRHEIAARGDLNNGDYNHKSEPNGTTATSESVMPSRLRDQRNALLDYVQAPPESETNPAEDTQR